MKRGWKTRDRFTTQTWNNLLIGAAIIVCLLNNTVHTVQVSDTKGTRFVFSTPFCSETSPAKLLVIPQTTIAVNVTIVNLEDNNTVLSTTIAADDSLQYNLPCTTVKWESILTSGFFLTSTEEVNVYVHNDNNDNCMVFPEDTAGTNYMITNIVTTILPESFIIIHGNDSQVSLTLPDTFVSSTLTISGVQYSTGSPVIFTLPEHGMLGLNCSCDLTGAIINSSRPISVFVGSYSDSTSVGVMEQILPTSSWGKRYLYSMSAWLHSNVTLIISGSSMNTMLSIETKGSLTSSTFTNSPYLTIQLVANDFISVEANETILCAVMYQIRDLSNTYHLTMKFVPPLELYHISLMFSLSSPADDIYSNIIAHSDSFEYITFEHKNGDPFNGAMTFYWGFYLCQSVYLTSPNTIRTNNLNTSPFIGSVITRSSNSAYEYSLGMRIANLYDACVETRTANGGNGDGIDNDCDNKIDEEKLNNVDDDNDGLVDEDVLYFGKLTNTRVDAWSYHQTHKEEEKVFSTSLLSVILSIVVALTSVGVFIAGMLIAERIRRSGSTRITPIYLEQQQQEPILQRY
ncbi:hypothetical protein ACF0H5_015523 [Mactra antiquata]